MRIKLIEQQKTLYKKHKHSNTQMTDGQMGEKQVTIITITNELRKRDVRRQLDCYTGCCLKSCQKYFTDVSLSSANSK